MWAGPHKAEWSPYGANCGMSTLWAGCGHSGTSVGTLWAGCGESGASVGTLWAGCGHSGASVGTLWAGCGYSEANVVCLAIVVYLFLGVVW